jgi:hypothetical protein
MPLKDHFHPPLSQQRHWHAFYNAWAANIAAALNIQLPNEYFAEPNVQFGIEVDVATFEERSHESAGDSSNPQLWSPGTPHHTIPLLVDEETVEVLVYSTTEGPTLVGAVELVSPSNKDRTDNQDAFLAKCETYLHQAVGLLVVDIVTNRLTNLHDALLERFDGPHSAAKINKPCYAAAYRPLSVDGQTTMEIWTSSLDLGEPLPDMPLWLRGGPCMKVQLDASYTETCFEHRIR